jgi:hypothetical protein
VTNSALRTRAPASHEIIGLQAIASDYISAFSCRSAAQWLQHTLFLAQPEHFIPTPRLQLMVNNMDTKNPLDFPYTALDDKEAVVRLVRIFREGDGSITGKLKEFCLDSPDCPSYMTLSYVCKNPYLFSLESGSIYSSGILKRVNTYYLLF